MKRNIFITILAIVSVIAIMCIVIIVNNKEKKGTTNIELSHDELHAVNYLLMFADTFKQPHSIKLYKVWLYSERKDDTINYYIAYNLSANNNIGGSPESTYGNKEYTRYFNNDPRKEMIKEKEDRKDREKRGDYNYYDMIDYFTVIHLKLDKYWVEESNNDILLAKEKGELLNAKKIEQAYYEQLDYEEPKQNLKQKNNEQKKQENKDYDELYKRINSKE